MKKEDLKPQILRKDGAHIIWRNFAGAASKYNREGDRKFTLIIEDPEEAQQMVDDGWNVKIKAPEEEGDAPFCYLEVKVKFNQERPRLNPNIYLKSGRKMNKLDEETVGMLDSVDIINVDLDVKGSPYDVNGKVGLSAYLQGICIEHEVDRFQRRFAEEEFPDE